jgi:hypothetical protein
MSFFGRAVTAPAPAAPTPNYQCQACRHDDVLDVAWESVRDVGSVWLCRDPSACRQRAQLRGIWKRYPRGDRCAMSVYLKAPHDLFSATSHDDVGRGADAVP